MTFDPPFRNISADIDETVAQLNELHAPRRARQDANLAALRAIVSRLDAPGLPDEPEATVERPQRDDPRRRPTIDEEPYVALPQRSQPARGGDYGPKVREKLRRIALEESGW